MKNKPTSVLGALYALTDTELEQMRESFAYASHSANWSPCQRSVLATMTKALAVELEARQLAWLGILMDPAVPPDWVTAVAALRLEDEP